MLCKHGEKHRGCSSTLTSCLFKILNGVCSRMIDNAGSSACTFLSRYRFVKKNNHINSSLVNMLTFLYCSGIFFKNANKGKAYLWPLVSFDCFSPIKLDSYNKTIPVKVYFKKVVSFLAQKIQRG